MLVVGLVVSVAGTPRAFAFSVLSHEAAIDTAWEHDLRPLLLRRFPATSPEALEAARSFAYGGSVIQDLGYYPFGNKFFSNLLHYVRSGDFVESLLRNAHDVNELAFALGALAHYTNDNLGHPRAVNLSVPLVFPKLRAKVGDVITYVDAPKQHVIVEFSHDVAQAARGRYSFTQYRSLIDFQVAVPLLERAFHETYGLEMGDIFADQARAIATYRYSVSQLIPALTAAAWRDKREEIARLTPDADQAAVVFAYRPADYERDYGRNYQKPALFARFLAVVYRIVPKVGPLKPLAFKAPTPDVDRLFVDGITAAQTRFQTLVRDVRDNRLQLTNTNFDTGERTHPHDYELADVTYGEWLKRLSDRGFTDTPADVRRDITRFYDTASAPPPSDRKARKRWDRVQLALAQLREAPPAATCALVQ